MGGPKSDDGVNWNKESLGLIEKGLKGAIDELKQSGSGATDALQGAGFEGLSLTGMEMGHHGLSVDFEDFCEKWEWGVRALVQNANALAKKLGLSAGMSYEEDQYAAGALKVGLNSLTGNPHATEEEVAKKDWGGLVFPYKPDYSAESFEKAGQDIEQDWQDTAREVTTKGRGGMYVDALQQATGVSDEQVAAKQDEYFGPSPEERAAARQGQQGQQQGQPGQRQGGEG
ncbi:hypothetical protein FM076_20230 [Streptomyces albus subsp. chlorinus]|uniref:hypothetical protein n=1 Tax=Streptomyces albus TaxID=1888 RepID=UPI00156E47F6|nr:hypothetical protein [Streptomyces albus]NSC23349.1 hypothetical protein [Streptomyces albus subsp. chlorinus]